MASLNILHVTAEYSNAVMLAILPYVTEFAQKLELPVNPPITTNHVWEFRTSYSQGDPGGLLVLTNGYRFWFGQGFVSGFEAPRNYFALQDPDLIPRFYGKMRMTVPEAQQLAVNALRKLGHVEKLPYLSTKPGINGPQSVKTNIVPHILFEWVDPNRETTLVAVEVNAEEKRVMSITAIDRRLKRDPPKISVTTENYYEYRKRIQGSNEVRRSQGLPPLPIDPLVPRPRPPPSITP